MTVLHPYNAHPVLSAFHQSDDFVRGVMGPFGSGKSSAMCMEIFLRACAQKAGPDGVRRSRWAVIRNTYSELESTTIKTWEAWFPPEVFGKIIQGSPITHDIRFRLPQGDKIALEVMFFPLDQQKDVKKLKSLELTGAWINEASEILEEAFEMISGRVGRYPRSLDGGASWWGVFMDYNPPPPQHWIYRLAMELTPSGYSFYRQPPAVVADEAGEIVSEEGDRYTVNGAAENLQYVAGQGVEDGKKYYRNFLNNKRSDFIKVYGGGEFGYVRTGKPVYTLYADGEHVAKEPLLIYPALPLTLLMDFGAHMAVLISQITPSGSLRVLRELYTEEGLETMLPMLRTMLATDFPGFAGRINGWGDPAGKNPSSHGQRNVYVELKAEGFSITPAPLLGNDFDTRKRAVDRLLKLRGGLVLDPSVLMLRAGFLGEYQYGRSAVLDRGRPVFKEKPVKNPVSHPHDALQYGALGLQGGPLDKSGGEFMKALNQGFGQGRSYYG